MTNSPNLALAEEIERQLQDGLATGVQTLTLKLSDWLAIRAAVLRAQPSGDWVWISVSERLPELGAQVITYHFLNRIDMLTFNGDNFEFPITCPVNEKGEPIGFTSRYPKDAITHWMPLPPPPALSAAKERGR